MPKRTASIPQLFRDMKAEYKADYTAATPSRFRRTRNGLYGSADAHYANDFNYFKVVEYVRDMDRNDGVLGMAVDRAVDNIVRTGFTLEPQTGDSALDKDLAQRFDDYAMDPQQCDVAGQMNFAEIERLMARSEYIDGDCFALGTEEGSLQVFECDRCRTPTNSRRNIIHGIEMDGRRRRLGYYFTKQTVDPMVRIQRVSDMQRVDAVDEDGYPVVFHLYKPSRFTQTRGITAFHAVFDKIGMGEDIDFALLVKQQMASSLAWSWQQDGDYAADLPTGGRTTETMIDGTSMTVEDIAPGTVLKPVKGQKLMMHSPSIVSTEGLEHLRLMMQIISLNLGLPLIVMMMDARETNFSGWRGALDQAKLGFVANQSRIESRFHRPFYLWRVRDWLRDDAALRTAAAKSTIRIFGHKWHKPRWPYVQPLDDAKADTQRVENYLASTPHVLAEQGMDPDEVRDSNIAFNKSCIIAAIEAAQEIKKQTGVNVGWRDVYNRAIPKGDQLIDTAEEPNTLSKDTTAGPVPGKTPQAA